MSQYHKLYTPEDSAVVFIDYQPQKTFGWIYIPRWMCNNGVLLAKAAKEFGVPVVLTAIKESSGDRFSGGHVWHNLLDIFPDEDVVERTSINAWDDSGFRTAIEATGRKNILLSGLWTEVTVTWTTIEMLAAGYNICMCLAPFCFFR